MAASMKAVVILAACCGIALLSALPLATAHGFMAIPRARQLLTGYNCPQCGQGNGPGNYVGICGDMYQGDPSTAFHARTDLPVQATYSAGQSVSLTVNITAQHGGRHSFRICPLSKFNTQATLQACFNRLEHQLTRVDNGKRYQYFRVGGATGTFTSQWRLPANIACPNGCMLQWWWVGYQNCHLPCEDPAWDVSTECGRATGAWNTCTLSNNPFPSGQVEQFYNCADVVINGGTGTTPIARPPPPPVTTARPPPPPVAVNPPPTTTCQTAAQFCSGRAPGYYGDRCAQCTKYFWCYSGGSVRMDCAPGLTMDSRGVKNYCDWPANNVC